jgi:hypothetical protein
MAAVIEGKVQADRHREYGCLYYNEEPVSITYSPSMRIQ